ncbi:hypothetical protein H8E77_02350 [bacterium]|nr:hypothetical protein [bacterium]
MNAKHAKSRRPIGIWDLSVSPMSLGGLLILFEELKIWSEIYESNAVDICVVGDIADLLPLYHLPTYKRWICLTDNSVCKDSVLLSMPLDMAGIETCYLFTSGAELQDFLHQAPYPYITWPALTPEGSVTHQYGRTMFIQEYYRKNGHIPFLSCKIEIVQWALQFIQNYVVPSIPVVVHLKNNPHQGGGSNANFDEWLSFFEACITRYNVKFILIGNEELDNRICKLPNTLVTRDLGSTLARDLALIQTGFIFLGMASGPCNIALFSDIPYVIYKNPYHHAEEMVSELGEGYRFPFATSFQKVLRIFETRENLISEFAHLYTPINRQDWERRLANLGKHTPG